MYNMVHPSSTIAKNNENKDRNTSFVAHIALMIIIIYIIIYYIIKKTRNIKTEEQNDDGIVKNNQDVETYRGYRT
jgi:phosphotransferase system  glucose/maltose/N-acetylglucosamine-specific IIC component